MMVFSVGFALSATPSESTANGSNKSGAAGAATDNTHAGGNAPSAGENHSTGARVGPVSRSGAVASRPAGSRPLPATSGRHFRPQPRTSLPTATLRRTAPGKENVFRTRDGRSHEGSWSRNDPRNKNRFDRQTQERLRHWQGHKSDFAEACRRHDGHHRRPHNRRWWQRHCPAIALIGLGYWAWFDGWWYPAWGYDSNYSCYEYDGPIYGYDGLLPDETIAEVQSALQELGYYPYEVDGIFGPLTQAALVGFQSDHGLTVTGAIDPPTLAALGLFEGEASSG